MNQPKRRPFLTGPLAACAIFLCAATAQGTDFLVANAAQVTTALAQAQPGDTLVMADGTWTSQDIQFAAHGTANNPITLRAQTPGRVILTGSSRLHISGSHLVVDGLTFKDGALTNNSIVEFKGSLGEATNSRLTNSAFVDYNPASINTRYFWVSLYGQNNRVDHNFFKGQNHSGVTLVAWLTNGVTPAHVIDNNHFVDRPTGNDNGFETIRLGDSSTQSVDGQMLVERNLFERTNGEIETISNKSSNNTFKNNTFRGVEGTLTLRHGTGSRVEGNFFLGENLQASGGVRIIDSDHVVINNYFQDLGDRADGAISISAGDANASSSGHQQVDNVLIAHNTIVNADGAAIYMDEGHNNSDMSDRAKNVTIANNILYSTHTLVQGTEGSNWTWAGNLAYGAAIGVSARPGLIQSDPQLVYEDGLWRPTSGSPAINNAAVGAWTAPTIDIDGQTRTSPLDIGADEVLANQAILNTPLSGSQVGPSWLNRRTMNFDGQGHTGIVIQAEDFTALRDPNNDGDTWSIVNTTNAFGGSAIKAPVGSAVTSPSSSQDAVVEYDVAIHDAGTYYLFMLVRGFDTSSDSVLTPAAITDNPEQTLHFGDNDGQWRWVLAGSYTITQAQVNRPLTLQLAKREHDAEIDMLILTTESNPLLPVLVPEPGSATLLACVAAIVLHRRS